MAKFSDAYNSDKDAIENGTWVPLGSGIKVKVRSFESSHTKALRTKLQAPYAHLTKFGKDIPEEDANQINMQLMAHSSILDWNITDEDDNKIPYDPAKAIEFMEQEPGFSRDIITALVSADTFRKKAREADSKN